MDYGSNYAIRVEKCRVCLLNRWGRPDEKEWYYEVRLPEMWRMSSEPPCGD